MCTGVVEEIGKGVSSVIQPIGKAVEDVGQAVGDVGASFEKEVIDPLGGYKVVAPIAAAVAAPYLLPELAALAAPEAAFVGATETGLATLAGEGALADTIGATLLSNAATEAALAEAIGQALPYTEAFDAVNLANQGLGAEQIAQNLTVSGLDSFLAEDMARLATQGLSPEQIATTLSYSYTPAELAGTGIESKALGAASKGLTAAQALQALRGASGLLGKQQPQAIPQMQMGGRTQMPQGAVDYSGIYNLLALQKPRNPNSLLG
ncbi:MAG: hypothetical protein EBU08_07635 [Micrococcales bacterium]|nr:hypothetical protein [Micrococcales bacterium]